MQNAVFRVFIIGSMLAITGIAAAAPVDWHGVFGADSTRIDSYRRVGGTTPDSAGSQIVPEDASGAKKASFQSYLLRINPSLIVNDSVTLNGELSTNYNRGGYLGDRSAKEVKKDGTTNTGMGNALYYQNTTPGSALVVNKFYAELFADTATFQVGRYTKQWGLGLIFNKGENAWDRHVSVQDGVDAKLKVGNFIFNPSVTTLSNGNSQVSADDVTDMGISGLYDNADKDFSFGVLYSKRKSKANNTTYGSASASGTDQNLGSTNVKIWDFFLRKTYKKYTISIEAPVLTGGIGHVYSTVTSADYKANAVVVDNSFVFNEKWTAGLTLGQVTGDKGDQSKFTAMYLNPNFQIAYLLFRYNLVNMSKTGTGSIYDSYITNTRFAKGYVNYFTDSWTFYGAFIYAEAMEVAKVSKEAFNHQKNARFVSQADQQKDYGNEVDLGVDYHWNSNVNIGLQFGYLFSGDYFGFTNTPTQMGVSNSYLSQANLAITF